MALHTTKRYINRLLKNFGFFEFESRFIIIKSFEPCIIPKVKIKINPKISSKLSGRSDVIHNPRKLETIENP